MAQIDARILAPAAPEAAAPATRARRKQTAVERFLAHRSATVGAAIVVVVTLIAAVTWVGVTLGLSPPFILTYSPTFVDPANRFAPVGASEHILGTDNLGRDTYSRTIAGSIVSLQVGFGVAIFTILLGSTIGLVAGYFRRLDNPLMRLMDSMMAFPSVILALAIMAVRGPSVENVILALSVVFTPRLARVVRSIVLTIRELQYIEAARALGTSDHRIITRHILPNCLSPMIVQATFIFAEAVLAEAGLSFLGVGTPPIIPSWGNMLGEARAFLAQAPWTMAVPGLALMVTVLGLNLFGDGIRDLLDPRLRRTS
ncbi:MAG: ABC transporter permease [Chloroflexi bacterium]|nr:ABC transporter permease [Chloroflexota bacterium]